MSIKKLNEAIDLIRDYQGQNPFLLSLRNSVQNGGTLNDFNIEYIHANINYQPKIVNKTVRIVDWFAQKKMADWNLEFLPEKILIVAVLGETDSYYHVYGQYRRSVPAQQMFIPKKAIIGNFLVEDYHNVQVDFERYNTLLHKKFPDRNIKEHQKEGVQFLLSRKKCILADDMGLGKLEPISALIPTPNGFKRMGEIIPGDKVFGRDGKEHAVLNIFPHKNKEIYKVVFSDNTEAECGLEHLWTVRDSNMRIRNKGWKTMTLKELIDSGLQYNDENRKKIGLNPRNKWEIPVCEAVEYPKKDYFISPYILGVMIGDGSMCCGTGIYISIPDTEFETSDRISSLLNEGYEIHINRSSSCPRHSIVKSSTNSSKVNLYNRNVKELGLNVNGHEKFIPEIYKLGSIEQRLDLLRGLMDSDGYITKTNNRISYTTVSEKLAYDVRELVYSLGGTARIHEHDRRKEGKNIEYSVLIQIRYNPFYLKRKAERYNPTFKKYCTKYIVSAEYVRNEDAQCIMVDSDEHTYLTGRNYIVTHNTMTLSIAAIEGNFDSILIICPASLKTNWKEELTNFVPERDVTIIEGYLDKTKPELEKYLGYGVGKSGKSVKELQEEAKSVGKWHDNRFVIVNYDILDEFYEFAQSRSKKDREDAFNNSPIMQYIAGKKSLIIIDEAHRLSNKDSGRYKIIKKLIKDGKPDSLYLATGTPITNNPSNFYTLLQLIEGAIPDDWEYFVSRYCGALKIPAKGEKERWTNYFLQNHHKTYWKDLTFQEKDELKDYIRTHARMITVLKDATNLEELRDRTAHIYLRRVKEDLNDLPNKTVHEVFYDFSLDQLAEYSKLWDEYEQSQLELDPSKELNKDLLEGAIYRRYCSDQMVPNTIKLTDHFINQGEKVIIACCYDNELYTLRDYYGDKCVIYNGKMSQKEKDVAKNAFLNDCEKMVFIGNIQAAGVGLTLTSSHIMIFNNMSFVPGDNSQMCDRIYRIGQNHDVDIYYQMFTRTQYEKMWNIVLRKQLTIDSVIKTEKEK